MNNSSIKDRYCTYLAEIKKIKVSTTRNYAKKVDRVDSLLHQHNKLLSSEETIWQIKDIERLKNILEFIKDEQSKNNGGIFAKEKDPSSWQHRFYSAAVSRFSEFVEWVNQQGETSEIDSSSPKDEQNGDNAVLQAKSIITDFLEKCTAAGLVFSADLIGRFIAALAAKPFVILTGLSGSGKTKIAQAFVRYLAPEQYKLVAVGADWINNEHLLGYANALDPKEYVMPETGVLELILQAAADENSEKPYFLILDEMNLSHVERYFADFLSAMESGEKIQLYSGSDRKANGKIIPKFVAWPKNLYIIGTMNVDETTYMFSPKVLDRAQVIEFRVNSDSMAQYLNGTAAVIDFTKLEEKGTDFANSFLCLASEAKNSISLEEKTEINAILVDIFNKLSNSTAEFGFRTAHEIVVFIANARYLMPNKDLMEIVDFAVMQKLLPKLHGSASALRPILQELVSCCFENALDENDFPGNNDDARFKVSHKKICRMLQKLESDGFASYPEA